MIPLRIEFLYIREMRYMLRKKEAPETSEQLTTRKTKLRECHQKLDQVEELLRESRELAVEGESSGAVYRIDKHLKNLAFLQNQLRGKMSKLDARIFSQELRNGD